MIGGLIIAPNTTTSRAMWTATSPTEVNAWIKWGDVALVVAIDPDDDGLVIVLKAGLLGKMRYMRDWMVPG